MASAAENVFIVDKEIVDVFFHYEDDVNLTNANFTKRTFLNGIPINIQAEVGNIGDGKYKLTLTPNAVGLWSVLVYETADAHTKYFSTYTVIKEQNNSQLSEMMRRLTVVMETALRRIGG